MPEIINLIYVDDEPALLEIAKIFLERTGEFQVNTYTSVQEALDSASIGECDVIISDYQMPGMNGIAFLKEVRNKFGDIPFILFTGHGREEVVIDAINNGADFYLQKGGEPKSQFAELSHKIKQAYRRSHAEDELSDSKRRLLDIIDFLPDATFAIDTNGVVIAWNRSIEDLTGVSATSILGKGNFEYSKAVYGEKRPMMIDLLNESNETILQYYSNVFRNGSTITGETVLKIPNGKNLSVLGKACLLYNQKGEVTGAIESIRDITELKEAESELLRSRERYHDLLNATDLIQSVDPKGRFLFVNNTWLETLGYKEYELEDITLFDVIHPESLKHCKETFSRVMSGETIELIDAVFKKKTGEKVFVQGMATCKISNNIPQYTRGIFKDVTHIKETETALIESEQKFRGIFEHSPYPIAINNHPDNKFIEVNKSFLELSGYSKEDIIGKDPIRLGLISMSDALKLVSKRIFAGKVENVPLAINLKDGRKIHVVFSSVSLKLGDKTVVLTLAAETTKLKRVEEELLKINEELSAAYEELTATEEELRKKYIELAKSEDELRASEEKFRSLVEYSLDGIIIADFSGNVLFINKAIADIVKIPYPDSTGYDLNLIDYVSPDSLQEVLNDLKNVRTGNDAYPVSYKILTKNKDEIWVECIGKKISYLNTDAIFVSVRDVTDRKIAEEKLQNSENKFVTLFDKSPLPLTLVEAKTGIFSDVSDVFLRNTGYCREELVGKKNEDIGLFVDPAEAEAFTTSVREKGFVNGMVIKCRIKNGNIATCKFHSAIVLMNQQPYLLSSVEDITEKRKEEEAFEALVRSMIGTTGLDSLKIITKNINSLLDADLVGIGKFQPDGNTVKLKSITSDIKDFEYSFNSAGNPCENLKNNGFTFYQDNISEIFPESRFLKIHNIRGYIGTPLKNSHGDTIGVLEILSKKPLLINKSIRDIIEIIAVKAASELERTAIENELSESEKKYHTIVDRSSDMIGIIDKDKRLVYASPASLEIFGYTPEEFTGKTEIFAAKNIFSDSFKDFMKTVAISEEGISSENEFEVQRKDKSKAYVNLKVLPIIKDGVFNGAQIRIQDITEKKISEKALKAANKKLKLLSGITRHDIKNQLMAMKGYVQIIEMKNNESSDNKFLSGIISSIDNIRDMIDFTKEYEDIGVNIPSWFNIEDIVWKSAETFSNADFSIKNNIPKDLRIFSDPLIEKVFYNLIDNAVRHETGASEIEFFVEEADEDLIIVCSDNGKGISTEDKERIFESGYGKNTGFGLYISRDILEITDLSIKETGEEGSGARFEIHVPHNQYYFVQE
ncbi:PAS domain S-box protein [Methanomicrobium antiquum]|uniref:histidine kinase n=1 Tax=Methanomicrobium antiquum TaxID=487686 RepID=A0AAF0JMF3_9EURY|nr:PAS domain S-box protein [Methanomicrobium antiquum]WFN37077.1 PAS domain S-box protein [Methanomicrobium antiquum]